MQRIACAFFICVFAFLMVSPQPARADAIDDVAAVLDYIGSVAPGELPFTGDDLRQSRALITTCSGSSDTTDVVQCIDDFINSPAYKNSVGSDSPSWLPELIQVYLDISKHDWIALLEDAGAAVACAAAQIITGGVDICGIAQTLIAAAEDVAKGVADVVAFLSDIGSDIAAGAKDVYCYFFGCSGPSGPSLAALAYANFYVPHEGEGVTNLLNDPSTFDTYYNVTVYSEGQAGGFSLQALQDAGARQHFLTDVDTKWDAAIVPYITKAGLRAFNNWNAAQAASYANAAMANVWTPAMASAPDWNNTLAPLLAAGRHDCVADIQKNGGDQADAWEKERHGQYPWTSSVAVCYPFETNLLDALTPLVTQAALVQVEKTCPLTANTTTYACGDQTYAGPCMAVLKFGSLTGTCTYPGAGIIPWQCPLRKIIRAPAGKPPEPGCQPAKVTASPPPGGGTAI